MSLFYFAKDIIPYRCLILIFDTYDIIPEEIRINMEV